MCSGFSPGCAACRSSISDAAVSGGFRWGWETGGCAVANATNAIVRIVGRRIFVCSACSKSFDG